MSTTSDSIAHYRLGGKLGEGGMGQVYRATDTKLHRDVALKLLPDTFSQDPERLERFRREARALAALSHPNIGGIFGLEESDGVVALVLELIEGPTLADRIASGPLSVEEALPIARQVAEALEGAHERGIVHRDLKPANIKVREDGVVKVLDFGLAKAVQWDGDGSRLSERDTSSALPTVTSPALTRMGMILGTGAYMSPEQAKGRTVDRRADIWAYGAVLFEMLTGRRLFEGDDLTEVLAALISTDPDLSRLPPSTPAWLRDVIDRCLRRDVSMRLPDIGAARIAIAEGASKRRVESGGAVAARPNWPVVALALAGGLTLGALAMWWLGPASPGPLPTTYSELVFDPPPVPDATPVISPDGRRVVYTGGDDAQPVMLYLRDLDTGQTIPIPGSEAGYGPAFSPDSRSVAFFSGGRLWAGAIGGALPKSVTPASGAPEGLVWTRGHSLIYATGGYVALQRVSASGGTPTPVQAKLEGVGNLRVSSPAALPDPDHLLVTFIHAGLTGPRIGVLSLVDGTLVEIAEGSDARFVAPSTLLFTRRGELLAAPFDPSALAVRGEARSLELPGVTALKVIRSAGEQLLAATPTAGLSLFPSGMPDSRALVWVDRAGVETATGFVFDEGRQLAIGANGALGAALSPDGRRVVLVASAGPMVVELEDVTSRRILPRPGTAIAYANWDTSGENVSVLGNQAGPFHGYLIPASGTGQPRQISAIPQSIPLSFLPDGKSILGYVVTPDAGRDLWVFGLDGSDTPFLQTPANERAPSAAPDGRAIVYVSDESGEDRIYVRLYPDVGQAWTISGNGATAPRWKRDGREIFFIQNSQVMAASIDLSDGVRVGAPRPLFSAMAYEQDPFAIPMYDVAADGRFLMVRRGLGVRTWRFIQNWGAALAAGAR
jgi:eukaryotic-like serine/threonine-protein kinase